VISSVGDEIDSDLGRASRVLFDQRRRRLKRDGVVPEDERDDDDEVDVESLIEGTQFGRGKTVSWWGLGPGRGWMTGAVRGILNKLSVRTSRERVGALTRRACTTGM